MVSGPSLCGPAGRIQPHLCLLSGSLFFYLKLALVSGIFLASPVIFWKFWSFVAPGLYSHEKKIILPFSIISSLCFIGGAAFAYYVVFPPAFRFLMGYSNEYLSALPTVKEYFSLSLRLLIGFGIIFEMPVFMVLLARLDIVTCRALNKNRKYGIVVSFIVAAAVTPTSDIVNQLLMALPLIVLYEISIVAVWLLGGKPDANGDEGGLELEKTE